MKKQQILPATLKINAGFSIFSGIILLAFNSFWSSFFAINFPFYIVGIVLIFFGVIVYRQATNFPLNLKEIKLIIGMDISWVISSIIVLLAVPQISNSGQWLIGIIAIFVADFALFQYIGLRQTVKQGQPDHA